MSGMNELAKITLITGGSGSGKSAYAEQRLMEVAEADNKYYLATMQSFGEEGKQRIARHRALRAGKGFETIEQPDDIPLAVKRMQPGKRAVLLECISNLVANEMFTGAIPVEESKVVDKVIQDIEVLAAEVSELILVSNNVFEDGIVYEDATGAYIRALGLVNERLSDMADEVWEVVVGIPLLLKAKNGRQKCQ